MMPCGDFVRIASLEDDTTAANRRCASRASGSVALSPVAPTARLGPPTSLRRQCPTRRDGAIRGMACGDQVSGGPAPMAAHPCGGLRVARASSRVTERGLGSGAEFVRPCDPASGGAPRYSVRHASALARNTPRNLKRTDMPLGTSLFLFAIGAMLRFAVADKVADVDLSTIGLILMIVGVVGIVISFFTMTLWSRERRGAIVRERRVVEREPYADRVVERDPYA